MSGMRLVAGLTLRDLRRNVGAWRLPALSSLLFAVLFVGSAMVTSAIQDRVDDLEFRVAVDGAVDEAPLAIAGLDVTRLRILEEPDAREAVRDLTASVGLTLPSDLDARLIADEQVELLLSQRANQNLSQEGTGWVLVTLSQIAGRDPVATIAEIDINEDDTVSRLSFGRTIAALTAFLALGVVTSTAAIIGGTRDRRGVEPLLVTPISRTAISGGTALGALPMAVLYVGAGLAVLLATATLPLPTLGQPASVLLDGVPVALLVVVAIAALGTGFGVVAGALGGGSSDAVGTGDLLAMPLAALGVLLLLAPDLATSPTLAAVPGLGVLLVLRDALAGVASPTELVIAMASTLLATALMVVLAGHLVGRERNVRRV